MNSAIEQKQSAARERIARLQSYLEHDPDNHNLLAELADTALSVGELGAARSAAQRGMELRPDDEYFALRLSSVALAEGNLDEAAGLTQALLARGLNDVAVRYNHAFALLHLGRYDEARPLFEGLHAEQAQVPMLLALLLRCLHYQGEVEAAIALAERHMQDAPDDAQIAGMLGLLYFDADDLVNARVWADRALALDHNNVDALIAASGTSLAAEDSTRARELSHAAVSLQPRSGRVWANLGLAALLDLDLNGAREQLSQAVKYMPGHIGTWNALAWVQLLMGDLDAAEASFVAALNIDDAFAESHGGMAAVAAARGDWQRADEESKIARRLDPASMSASYAQIVKLQQEGRGELAQRMIRSALEKGQAPGGGSLVDMVARIAKKNSH